ncbi:MAG: hypothetical protein H0U52_16390 [Chloroflexi bacterium]|nr:hypothetical protein [Chloroflexota bacterium]
MRAIRILAALALILGSVVFATPVAAGDPCYHGEALPARSEGDETQIKMMPCAFAPTVVRVAPGTIVEWFNHDTLHLLTGANQEWGFRDDQIAPGETVAFRFDRPGTYPYACALHRGMAGTIVVGDGIALAAAAGAGPAVVHMKGGSSPPPASQVALVPAASAPVQPAVAAAAVTPSRSVTDSLPVGIVAAVVVVAVAGVAALAFVATRKRSTIVPTRH